MQSVEDLLAMGFSGMVKKKCPQSYETAMQAVENVYNLYLSDLKDHTTENKETIARAMGDAIAQSLLQRVGLSPITDVNVEGYDPEPLEDDTPPVIGQICQWERIVDSTGVITERLKVFGGWLVNSSSFGDGALSESMCFVADPRHEWQVVSVRK